MPAFGFDKEYLPASTTAGLTSNPIEFGWGDKIAPRIGAAWDVFKDGRMKVFGSYGKFFDIMKLNVAISSFGGQYWNDCAYALNTSDLSTIVPALNSAGRFCVGSTPTDTATGANWAGGSTPAGLTFIENVNNRTFPTTCSTCALTSTGGDARPETVQPACSAGSALTISWQGTWRWKCARIAPAWIMPLKIRRSSATATRPSSSATPDRA